MRTISIYTLLVKSQLRWAGYVVLMEDSRMPKALFYGQLKHSTRHEWRPLFRYKDTLKCNIKHCGLNLSSWEVAKLNRPFWRSYYNAASKEYENHCIQTANEKRVARKSRMAMISTSTFACSTCGKYAYHELEYPRIRGHIRSEMLICRNRREMPS